MLYRNKNNGRIIDVKSEMGGVWEPVKAPATPKKAETPKVEEAPKEEAPKKKGKKR